MGHNHETGLNKVTNSLSWLSFFLRYSSQSDGIVCLRLVLKGASYNPMDVMNTLISRQAEGDNLFNFHNPECS